MKPTLLLFGLEMMTVVQENHSKKDIKVT
jgi:hypothetical protein